MEMSVQRALPSNMGRTKNGSYMGDREAADSFLCEANNFRCEIRRNGHRLMRRYCLCPIDRPAGREEERACAG
jgi:hypothetical protein